MNEQEVIALIASNVNQINVLINQSLHLAKEHNVPFSFYRDVSHDVFTQSEPDDEEWSESEQWYDSGCSEDYANYDWNESSC